MADIKAIVRRGVVRTVFTIMVDARVEVPEFEKFIRWAVENVPDDPDDVFVELLKEEIQNFPPVPVQGTDEG